MEHDQQKITAEDAANLVQFSIASLCQTERISYINGQSLDMLTQFLIDEVTRISHIAQTVTLNSARSTTNTTDLALALETHGENLDDIAAYLQAPIKLRADIVSVTSPDVDMAPADDLLMVPSATLPGVPAPIPDPIEPNNQQYPVTFNYQQANDAVLRAQAEELGVDDDGNLVVIQKATMIHQTMPHIPPFFPMPPPVPDTGGQNSPGVSVVRFGNQPAGQKKARHF